MAYMLDFEKPIFELDEKLSNATTRSLEGEPGAADEVYRLKKEREDLCYRIYTNLTPWQRVQLARHPERPYTMDYVSKIFTDFIDLHGDRRFADDAAVVGGFAKLDGMPVMIIGTQKGRNTKESVDCNFGCPRPEGYRKANRLMKIADLACVPILTFIDTPGGYPGVDSEERHIGESIAVNLRDMFDLTVPVICTVIGEGGSGGALGIGVGNKVLLLENAYYSVITPEGCAAILWKDRAFTGRAAEALHLTARDLLELKLIDGIIPEPLGGAQKDPDAIAADLKNALLHSLKEFKNMTPEQIREHRYRRFRKIEFYQENALDTLNSDFEDSAEEGEMQSEEEK